MDAPRALVFWPLVKGNEALATRLGFTLCVIIENLATTTATPKLPPFPSVLRVPISFPELRSPWPAVGKRELWGHHFQMTMEITEFCISGFTAQCAVCIYGIYGTCLKWMLLELSFSDSWSRGTKLWKRDCTCGRHIGSKSTNHSPLAGCREGHQVTLVVVIGGFRSDVSITHGTDGNFGNVSAGVLFSKVAYKRKRW